MFKEILRNIDKIEIIPEISMVIFCILFVLVILWVIKLDKEYITKLSNMPIDNEKLNVNNSGN